jgi:hypothetical protein
MNACYVYLSSLVACRARAREGRKQAGSGSYKFVLSTSQLLHFTIDLRMHLASLGLCFMSE